MGSKHHCNGCPHWYVTKKKYPSEFYNITLCRKYGKQIYYLAGSKNQTPYPCSACEKEFSYVPYIKQEISQEVEQVAERLTIKRNNGDCVLKGKSCFYGWYSFSLDREFLTKEAQELLKNAFYKLEEYETAEEEGRLVVLPCKVGDILFCFSCRKIYPFKVRSIRIYEDRSEIELWYAGDEENLKFWNITIMEQDVGYKFFFTRDEAEKALKEMENNYGKR